MIKRISRISLLLFLLLINYVILASGTDSLKVIVLDEVDAPVEGVKVSIQGLIPFISKKDGTYRLLPSKKLVFPLNATIEKKGYEIDELNYYNTENEIEVRIKRITKSNKSIQISVLTVDKKSVNGLHLTYSNKYYTSANGELTIPEKSFDEKLLQIEGFIIDHVKKEKERYYVFIKPATKPLAKTTSTSEKSDGINSKTDEAGSAIVQETKKTTENKTDATSATKLIAVDPKLSEEAFAEYKKEFDQLSNEVIQERTRLIESNNKIREQIERATNKLKNEKNLTSTQREELRKSIEQLEGELVQNSIAYNKADEKTMHLIHNLELIVMQKDSINSATIKMLKVEQKKVVIAERKTKRTIIIFTIISISLVLLAVVFYSIARKMRNHKTELLKVNEELINLKRELAEVVSN